MDEKEYNAKKSKQLAKKIAYLDDPGKRPDVPPEKLLEMLPIKQTDSLLDLGAGTGYFTIPFAKAVEGFVYALDIDANMLDLISSKAREENIANFKPIKGYIDDIPLADQAIDFAFASLVLHEVEHLPHSLLEIKRVLKNNGYFVCIEFEKETSPTNNHPRISSSLMEQEIIHAGLKITQVLRPTDGIYMMIARK